MVQYIDKSALVAEIERILSAFENSDVPVDRLRASILIGLLSFINSLEVKEVDLEKELDDMITPELKFHKALPSLFDVAKHFFELGLNMKKDSLTPDDIASIHSIVNDLIVASRIQFTEWDGKNIFDEALKIFKERKKGK